jgi:hypothetical protein
MAPGLAELTGEIGPGLEAGFAPEIVGGNDAPCGIIPGERRFGMALEKELETFHRELPKMLAEHPGEFVLIGRGLVDSFWPTEDEGYEAGCRRFGLEPFLVKQVQQYESPVTLFVDVTPPCPS